MGNADVDLNVVYERTAKVVQRCGKIVLGAADISRRTHAKQGKGNFVTDYDAQVQSVLREGCMRILPQAAFMGEESDMDKTDVSEGYAFIVDPIDGTANFTRGLNWSAISVALACDGIPVMGIVCNPYTNEMYHAVRGAGAYCNNRKIHVSEHTLEEGIFLMGTAPYHPELARASFETAFGFFARALDLRRSGSAALDLCTVASGKAELYFEMELCPWDYAAGALIVEEAGGIISDLDGNPVTYDHSQTVLARAPKVSLR